MRTRFCCILMALCAAGSVWALPPLTEELPPAYEEYAYAVYGSVCTQAELDSLYGTAVRSADAYEGHEQKAVLALCDFMRGMESYLADDYKTAGTRFDSAQQKMQEAVDLHQTALNTAYLAQIVMQNAAVKGISFQLKYVPGLPDLIQEALAIDPHCTQALYMQGFYNCTVPVPYGTGYAKGAEAMRSLLESDEKKTPVQTYLILTARGYALAKKNRKADAAFCYEQALTIFPHNTETLAALAALRK